MQVTIAEFLELKFTPASRPSAHSVRRWIKQGVLPYPVQRFGSRWYIELDPEQKKTEVDPLFLKIVHGK